MSRTNGRAGSTNGWLDPRFLLALVVVVLTAFAGYFKNQSDVDTKIKATKEVCLSSARTIAIEEIEHVISEDEADELKTGYRLIDHRLGQMEDAQGRMNATLEEIRDVIKNGRSHD